jgi:penicillin V acylase-like amidase (Ntn superfamily)
MKKLPINFFMVLGFTVLFFYGGSPGYSCSTFLLQEGKRLVFGKNFDFHTGSGMVMVNKRGVAKTALLLEPDKPAQWVSKYGSITFNQVGREFPFGGMNEAGLVIEVMWLEGSQFPAPDERPAIDSSQWIQYQLDNCGSVAGVIASDTRIRISQGDARIHYLAADRSGNAATIEFIDGKPVYHTAKNLPAKALTNNTYSDSLAYLIKHVGFGGKEKISDARGSLDRFVRISNMLEEYRKRKNRKTPIVNYGFDILAKVCQGEYTVWSIVYDMVNLHIHFKTVEKKDIKVIRLKDFDFSCGSPVKVLDIDLEGKGDVTRRFIDYSTGLNREMVLAVFKHYRSENFMTDIPDIALEVLAKYPDRLKCK